MQQLQSLPFNIKAFQAPISLVKQEKNTNKPSFQPTTKLALLTGNSFSTYSLLTPETKTESNFITQFSSLPQPTDTSEKARKSWIKQTLARLQSSWVLVKTRVSAFDRKVRLEKYRLSQIAAWHGRAAGGEFLTAFVFGSVTSLEKTTKNNLKTLGLLHIASASGANVAIVTALITRGLGWLKTNKLKYLILLVAIFCYADLAEFSASIVRASLGTGYKLFGELWLHRPIHPLVALGISAITMVVIRPDYLSNLSFQLSCLATLGLACFSNLNSVMVLTTKSASTEQPMLLVPVWTDGRQPHVAAQSRWGERLAPFFSFLQNGYRRITQTLFDSFWTSVAAQLFITPFLWWKFGDWSPLSLVANPLLLWLTPVITQLSLALVVTTVWADKWPLEFFWYVQRLLGELLNFSAQWFQFGVTWLSRTEPWLTSHSWFQYSIGGWWLLSGFIVVKTFGPRLKHTHDTF